MHNIEHSIVVDAPVNSVYNQWTQFEDFPQFMEGVQEVRQHGDKRLFWRAEIAGKVKEWEAEIFEQIPDQRIAWRSITGEKNSGMVNFYAVGMDKTRIELKLNYDPEGALEKVGDALGVVSRRVKGDLGRFKAFIERRGHETGGWRGEIHGRQLTPDPTDQEPRSKRLHS